LPPSPETAALAHAIRDATVARKAAVEEDGRLRNLMRLLLEEHSGVEDEDYRIHFRRSADRLVSTTDWQRVAGISGETLDAIGASFENADAWPLEVEQVVRDPGVIESLNTTTEVKEGSRS